MTKVLLFAAINLIFLGVNAQNKSDSAKIISYEEQVMVRINFDTNVEDYIAAYKEEGKNLQTRLRINNKVRASFSVDYKLISAAISFAPGFFPGNNDNALKGESSYTDFKFRFFPKRFIQSFNYRNVKGFYLDNMEDFEPEWKKGIDPYFQFPDLKIQTFGGSTSYVFNKDFSLKSIYYQREWQKESCGSFIPVLEYDLSYFTNETEGLKNRERQFNLGLNLGYHYNWVIAGKVNIAPYIFAGAGGKWSQYRKDLEGGIQSGIEKNKYFTAKLGSGIHVGYNSEKFLFGAKFNITSAYYKEDSSSEVTNNNVFGLLYFGYRFPPPGILKRNYDKIQKKIPVL